MANKRTKELAKLKQNLTEWLQYRFLIRQAAEGRIPGADQKAASAIAGKYNKHDVAMAEKIKELLVQVDEESVGNLPEDPEELARMVIKNSGGVNGPVGAGILPLVIVGGVALVIMYALKTRSDVAKEQARIDCIKVGACPPPVDWGKWIKFAAIAGGLWFAWQKGWFDKITKKALPA